MLNRTIRTIAGVAIIGLMFLVSAGKARATDFINFTYSDSSTSAHGTLLVESNWPGGTYTATSGILNVTSGPATGVYGLYPNPNAPNWAISPFRRFSYNNVLYPGQDPSLDIHGLLFTGNGREVNIWGTGAGKYTFASSTGADAVGNVDGRFFLLDDCNVRDSVNVLIVDGKGPDTLILATFYPRSSGLSPVSPMEMAVHCGYDHFNWIQTITQMPRPFRGYTAPCLDPPLGGWGYEGSGTDYLPFYMDEPDQIKRYTNDVRVLFEDQPQNPSFTAGESVDFATSLVGVRSDYSFDVLYTFTWSSNYTGDGSGGIRLKNLVPATAGGTAGGTGGVFNVVRDVSVGSLPVETRALMIRAGARNVSSAGVTASASRHELWPPDGKLVEVTVSGQVTSGQLGANVYNPKFWVNDDYGIIQLSGPIALMPDGSYSFPIQLEAARRGDDKQGRKYSITVQAQDPAGNPFSATCIVTVPHDKR